MRGSHASIYSTAATTAEVRGPGLARTVRTRPVDAENERVAAAFCRLLDDREITGYDLARRCGLNETRIRAYRSGDAPIPYSVVRIAGLAVVLEAELALAPSPSGRSVVSHGLCIMSLAGELASEIDSAMADGRLTDDELDAISAKLARLQDQVERLRGDVRASRMPVQR